MLLSTRSAIPGSVAILLPGDTAWGYPGKWFNSFIELGKALVSSSSLQTKNSERALLVVPRRDLVAAAIGLGMSSQKFAERHSLSRSVSIDELASLAPRTQIRASWPGRTRDAIFLGLNKDKDPWRISLQVDGEPPSEFGFRNVEISIPTVGTPMGEKTSIDAAGDVTTVSDAARAFHNQISPAGAFFSEGSYFEKQLAAQIRFEPLDTVFSDGIATIQDGARFDYLENDKHPHFVNVFALTSRLNNLDSREVDRVRACDWAILDGNTALGQLSTSEHLYGKRVLGIMDASNTVMQEQAFQSFASESGRLWREDSFEVLGWRPPIGTFLWSWGRNGQ